jgi:predicted nucleic acid-binding protein
MDLFVLDSSVATAWCFEEETTPYTEAVLAAVSGTETALAPRLWAYELRNSVLVGVRRGRITAADAEVFFASLPDLRMLLVDPVSYDAVYALAAQQGLSVYDASYLDLALRKGLPLASLDRALLRAAESCGVAPFRP